MSYSIDTTKYIEKMKSFCKGQGVNIDLENPKTIQDKLAWLNIYDCDPLKVRCTDRNCLHGYCREVLGEDLCVPIIDVTASIGTIDWERLPNKFVIRCNHGNNSFMVVDKKKNPDLSGEKRVANYWLRTNFAFEGGFISHLNDITKRIIIEEYKKYDYYYRFWCFDGKVRMYSITDAKNEGETMFYKMNHQEWNLYNIDSRDDFVKPSEFKQLKSYAERLSNGLRFARVGFFISGGRIYLDDINFAPDGLVFRFYDKKDEVKVGKFLGL